MRTVSHENLVEGTAAHLVVFDDNRFAIRQTAIGGTRVPWTPLDGREVFRHPHFRRPESALARNRPGGLPHGLKFVP